MKPSKKYPEKNDRVIETVEAFTVSTVNAVYQISVQTMFGIYFITLNYKNKKTNKKHSAKKSTRRVTAVHNIILSIMQQISSKYPAT